MQDIVLDLQVEVRPQQTNRNLKCYLIRVIHLIQGVKSCMLLMMVVSNMTSCVRLGQVWEG